MHLISSSWMHGEPACREGLYHDLFAGTPPARLPVDASRRNSSAGTGSLWSAVDKAAARMEQCVVSIHHEWPDPGLVARDALQRPRLGPVVERCGAVRMRDT